MGVITDRCPGCDDMSVCLGKDEFGDDCWLALGWADDGERDTAIFFCPFCGLRLNPDKPVHEAPEHRPSMREKYMLWRQKYMI